MKLPFLSLLVFAAVPALSAAAPTVWGVNDHAYELIVSSNGLPTYAEAKTAAQSTSFRGVQGRLVVFDTANYAAELSFVRDTIVRPNASATGYWVGATRPNGSGNMQENWTWDDGSSVPTSVTDSWRLDAFEGNVPYAGFFYSDDNYATIWDYAQSDPTAMTGGYVVEYAAPVPEPATLLALGCGAVALIRRRRA